MKKLAFVFAGALAVAACETTPDVTAATQFFGKELVGADGTTFLFSPDGTVGGTLAGEPVVGTFEATATEICSEYTSPERLVGTEFCSTPIVEDGSVTFARRDGTVSQAYAIGG